MNKNHKTFLAVVLIVCILGGLWTLFLVTHSAITGDAVRTNVPVQEPIAIGAIYPLTGQYAFGGVMANGAQMAIDDINARGGIRGRKLVLFVEDSQGDAAKGIAAFNKLYATDNVRYYMTVISRIGMPLKPIVENKQVLLFADITHPDLLTNTSYIVRHSQTINQETKLVSALILRNKYTRVALFVMNEDYGLAYEREMRRILGDDVALYVERVDPSGSDFKTSITKILSTNPDVIIVVAAGKNFGNAVKECRTEGYLGDFIFSLSMSISSGTLEAAQDAKQGAYYLNFDPKILPQTLKERYTERYGQEPGLWATIAYTDVELLAHAISEVGDDPKTIATFIKQVGIFNGTYESISIMPEGDIYPPIVLDRFE